MASPDPNNQPSPPHGVGVTQFLEQIGPVAAIDPTFLGPYLARSAAYGARSDKPNVLRAQGAPGVAVVDVVGPLSRYALAWGDFVMLDGYDRLAAQVRAAIADPSVDAIALRVDSPGGSTTGLFETIRQLRAELDAAGKPVAAFADELAASAGYAIAAGLGDTVHLPPEGMVGSIGTIATHVDITKALENAGVKVTHVVDPPGKSMLWPQRALDEASLARLQERVSEMSSAFYGLVAPRRGMTAEAVQALDARMFTGSKAVSAGLADAVGSWSQVVAGAAEMAQKKRENRKMASAIRELLGLSESASAEDVEKAAAEKRPLLALGTATLEITGASSADAAKGVVMGWKESAAELVALQATAATDKQARDKLRREAIYVEIAKKTGPASIWNGGKKEAGAQAWAASMSLESLEGYLSSRPVTAAFREETSNSSTSGGEPTDAEVRAYAAEHGIKNLEIARHGLKQARAAAESRD